ncbi:Uncharacterized conserved protein YndB, AHSA1/START domain [Streptomyces zhaozhouensis]|uniref:Uncharacterized conserved protein YndB, AHSA1/START domain n=1 Tax=Streptomyces zhaozhouensis TaxID=1300267 RepID=A0A286E0A0_9ACTN|nr:SRPBCC domain-containing protein [Streptomyces zhaozhouensis]SOD64304.1 Uncharacterized conserved protein YndB, AHSA1/START domain [Streptomyces zhaozhouensis]
MSTITHEGRPALRVERRLPRPVEAVWRAVSEPARLSTWYPMRVTALDARVGGRIVFDNGEDTVLNGTVTAWEPPRLLAFDEHGGGEDGPAADDHLRIELHDDPAGCLLVLIHVPHDFATAMSAEKGWNACLDQLVVDLSG